MKPLIFLAAALAALPATAQAQSYDDPSFGGVKIGAGVDYRWYDAEYALPRIATKIDDNRGSIGYRGHIGYDLQLGKMLVVGGEAGIGRGGKALTASSTTGDYSIKPRWTWDVSGRAGVLVAPTVLLYGRAGYSWARVREVTDFRASTSTDIRKSGTEKGFLYGGGIETAITAGFSARAEFNQINYGDGFKSSRAQVGLTMGF
jgi:opacity protein-like surface antigen